MTKLLMPIGTAIWLIKNTAITFEQIAEFCKLDSLLIQEIADENIHNNIKAENPIINDYLTIEEIKKCENDSTSSLIFKKNDYEDIIKKIKVKKTKYTTITHRRNIPSAILWVLKHYPNITVNRLVKLLRTTKKTVLAIQSQTYTNYSELSEKDPTLYGICNQEEIDEAENLSKQELEKEILKNKITNKN